jgi:hypothetical protein
MQYNIEYIQINNKTAETNKTKTKKRNENFPTNQSWAQKKNPFFPISIKHELNTFTKCKPKKE